MEIFQTWGLKEKKVKRKSKLKTLEKQNGKEKRTKDRKEQKVEEK
jgi:hypothetical protein